MPKRGGSKPAGKLQESATFLQRSFSMLQCSFSFAAAQLLVQMMSALQRKANVAVQFLQRNIPKTAVQLPFSLVACCRGWGLEGWGLGLAERGGSFSGQNGVDLSVFLCFAC